jgi:hypothetical protein
MKDKDEYGYGARHTVGDCKKVCHCCLLKKEEGKFYQVPSKPLYRRFVCEKCFNNARHPFVLEVLEERRKNDLQARFLELALAPVSA